MNVRPVAMAAQRLVRKVVVIAVKAAVNVLSAVVNAARATMPP